MKPRCTAIIPTRGNVDLSAILLSLPAGWEVLIWDNGAGEVRRRAKIDRDAQLTIADVSNLGPYARFAAIEYAAGDLVYCQDDDVIVSDPQAIIVECDANRWDLVDDDPGDNLVVCNVPQEFRPHYPDSAMVGFGAAFHRGAPAKAFDRFFAYHTDMSRDDPLFLRESCRVFTTLTPRILVDVPRADLPWASAPNRLWKQPEHVEMRERMLALAREVRDNT